jgi:MFS family permease
MAQVLCAPLAGWYADRTSVRAALATSILAGLASFVLVSTSPGVLLSIIAVFVAGLAFVLGKIALNTVLVLHSSPDTLRRSVAKRATLLNLGSFTGNSIALQMTTRVGFFESTSLSSRLCRSGTLLPLMPAPITSIPKSLYLSASAFLMSVT